MTSDENSQKNFYSNCIKWPGDRLNPGIIIKTPDYSGVFYMVLWQTFQYSVALINLNNYTLSL